MKTVVALSLVGAALGLPTKTIENRQFGSLGSGLGSSSGLGALSSLIPSSGSGLGGLGSLGGSSSESGLGALASLLPSSSSGLGGLDGLSGLSGLGSLGGSSSDSGLGALASLLPSSGGGLGDLSSLGSLGGSSSDSGLGALSSLIPSLGSGLSDSSSSSGISSLLGGLSKRQLTGSVTANDVTDKASCKELTFIFARGSDEVGNMGSVVGPPVATQLKSLTGNKVNVQGVTYAATAESNVALGANGGPIMANLVETALQQCPDTKVVLGGYSQGAMVVHNAASRLTQDQVAGAVLFGDPFKTQAVGKLASSKVKEYCASGDPVCENGFNVMAHLTYGSNAKEAAQFLIQAAGISSS
ncbi:putative cutinase 1 [Penicillium rolfsii]|nr:putative cutinase 1 [Penicillium rolfsii]